MNFKRLRPKAILPTYATVGSAGLDLYACLDQPILLYSNSILIVPTGIAVDLTGYEGQIRSRSGLAAKHGVFVLNSPGTIDGDYRGEIKVILSKIELPDDRPYEVNHGDRIAQLVISEYFKACVKEVTDFEESTERGSGGFGSTGR